MPTFFTTPDLASRLPLDVALQVISHMDSGTAEGRRTLAACARVSRACRVPAENALYRHVIFDPPHLTTFLLNLLGRGSDLGDGSRPSTQVRAKRLIGVIEHLTIWDGWRAPGVPIELVWEAAALSPGNPLFPRVRHVAIQSSKDLDYSSPPALLPHKVTMPPRILVFDEIDVCVTWLPTSRPLDYLPPLHVTSFTAHDISFWEWIEELLLPPTWGPCGSFRMYDGRPSYTSWSSNVMRRLEAKARGLDSSPFHVIVYGANWKQESLENLARVTDWEEDPSQPPWRPVSSLRPSPANKVQLEWCDPENPACPACVVCGTCARYTPLMQ